MPFFDLSLSYTHDEMTPNSRLNAYKRITHSTISIVTHSCQFSNQLMFSPPHSRHSSLKNLFEVYSTVFSPITNYYNYYCLHPALRMLYFWKRKNFFSRSLGKCSRRWQPSFFLCDFCLILICCWNAFFLYRS